MAWLSSKSQKKRKTPTESVHVTENMLLDLWVNDNDTYNWSLSRANPKDSTKSFRMLRPEDALDAITGISYLMKVLSGAPGFSANDHSAMRSLADDLEKVVTRHQSRDWESIDKVTNGEAKSHLASLNADL